MPRSCSPFPVQVRTPLRLEMARGHFDWRRANSAKYKRSCALIEGLHIPGTQETRPLPATGPAPGGGLPNSGHGRDLLDSNCDEGAFGRCTWRLQVEDSRRQARPRLKSALSGLPAGLVGESPRAGAPAGLVRDQPREVDGLRFGGGNCCVPFRTVLEIPAFSHKGRFVDRTLVRGPGWDALRRRSTSSTASSRSAGPSRPP